MTKEGVWRWMLFIITGLFAWFMITLVTYLDHANSMPLSTLFYLPLHDLYVRIIILTIFTVSGFFAAQDISQRARAEQYSQQLYSSLKSIRKINQIITRTSDVKRLFQKSADILLETRGYLDVSIAIRRKEGVQPIAHSGTHKRKDWIIKSPKDQNAPKCIRNALETPSPYIIEDTQQYCDACEFCEHESSHKTVFVPMSVDESINGFIIVCFKTNRQITEEEIELLEEVAGDLNFARSKIKAEEELQVNEQRYRTLVEQSHDGIYIYWKNRLKFVNERMCNITGYEKTELYQLNLWKLLHPEDRKRIKEIERKRRKGRSAPNKYDARIITKGGEIRYLEFAIRYIQYKGKNAVIGTVRDTTERKKVEEKLATIHSWAQKLNKADKIDKIFEYTLDAMEKTLGFEHATIEVKKQDMLKTVQVRGFTSIPQKELPLNGKGIVVKTARTGRTIIVDDVESHPEYLPRFSKTKSEMTTPVQIDNKLFGVLNAESTQKNAFDQQDKRLLETLASHVAVAIKELREKKKRITLQRLDELRSRFLAMAAHEINTPLTPIKTDLELLQRKYYGDLTTKQEQKLQHLLENVDRLSRLVEDFQRSSKLFEEQITLKKKEHELTHTVEKALNDYKYVVTEEEILVKKNFPKPLTALYDEERILQVIGNLVENAIDYTKDMIWIKGGEEDDHVYLLIQDNGPGIPKEQQERIFEPFYGVKKGRPQREKRFGGTGIGLHICQRIIEAHNGKISVYSSPNDRTTFRVSLPKTIEETR